MTHKEKMQMYFLFWELLLSFLFNMVLLQMV